MIISPNRKLVFIHLHKCAGTSIENALEPHLGVGDLIVGSTETGERHKDFFRETMGLRKHGSALDARQFLGPERYAHWFSFAFVRHPVERLRSLYNYSRTLTINRPLNAAERAAFEASGTLPVRAPYKFKAVQAALRAADFNAFVLDKTIWKDPGAQPQWASLCDEQGRCIVDFIGQVEQMATHWPQVCDKLRVDAPIAVHNSSKVSASTSLSEEAWALLERKYHQDCEKLGYRLRELPGASA